MRECLSYLPSVRMMYHSLQEESSGMVSHPEIFQDRGFGMTPDNTHLCHGSSLDTSSWAVIPKTQTGAPKKNQTGAKI